MIVARQGAGRVLVDEFTGAEAHVGPSRMSKGRVAIFVQGPEPNAVAAHFIAVALAIGAVEECEVPRPRWCGRGLGWATFGEVR